MYLQVKSVPGLLRDISVANIVRIASAILLRPIEREITSPVVTVWLD